LQLLNNFMEFPMQVWLDSNATVAA